MSSVERVGVFTGVVLGGVYAASVSLKILDHYEIPYAEMIAVGLGLVTLAFLGLEPARRVLRFVSLGHALLAFSFVHILSKFHEIDWVPYFLTSVLLPTAVGLLIISDRSPAKAAELPPGHDYMRHSRRSIGVGAKLLILAGVALAIPFSMGLGMVLFWILIPVIAVGFGLYYIVSILLNRRRDAPLAARRVKVAHGQIPARIDKRE